mmetsp:Transcript_21897/g.46881  ORF Transcript_21897/g.46881 Transcript_21897/m.46881 type:complete len:308 (+) Transcript_21897:605-1528(+)
MTREARSTRCLNNGAAAPSASSSLRAAASAGSSSPSRGASSTIMPIPPPRSVLDASKRERARRSAWRRAREAYFHQCGRTPRAGPSSSRRSGRAHRATAIPLTMPFFIRRSTTKHVIAASQCGTIFPTSLSMVVSPASSSLSSSTFPEATLSYASASRASAARRTGLKRAIASDTSARRSSLSSASESSAPSPASLLSPPSAAADRSFQALSAALAVLSPSLLTGHRIARVARRALHHTLGWSMELSTFSMMPGSPCDSVSSSDMMYCRMASGSSPVLHSREIRSFSVLDASSSSSSLLSSSSSSTS